MKYIAAILLVTFSLFSEASVTCEGATFVTKSKVKVVLSDIKGEKIQIEEFFLSDGKMTSLGKKDVAFVAEGKYVFGEKAGQTNSRTYLLLSSDKSYAQLFLISADGSALYMARPMPGSPDAYDAACKNSK